MFVKLRSWVEPISPLPNGKKRSPPAAFVDGLTGDVQKLACRLCREHAAGAPHQSLPVLNLMGEVDRFGIDFRNGCPDCAKIGQHTSQGSEVRGRRHGLDQGRLIGLSRQPLDHMSGTPDKGVLDWAVTPWRNGLCRCRG